MVSGETPAAAAESLHAKPWAIRSTSARSAGVRLVPSMNFAANGVRISISIWAMVAPSPEVPAFGRSTDPSARPRDASHAPARLDGTCLGDDNNAPSGFHPPIVTISEGI